MKRIIIILAAVIALQSFYSFTVKTMADDFLKQLGITKVEADEKISGSILDGSVDTYGLKKAKSILQTGRSAVTKDILAYTKKHLQSAVFKKEYETLKEKKKPTLLKTLTPEDWMANNVASIQRSLNETTASMKKSDASMKPMFEKIIAQGQKQLAEAEDPESKQNVNYKKKYSQSVKDADMINQRMLSDWENKYPADPMQFVKRRLEEFLQATQDIDFDAELVTKNGKQVFVNAQYERKDSRWKMAFRAGKEVVEPARNFVQQWISEIK